MKTVCCLFLITCLSSLVLTGCEVTPEKVELWKTTKNGSKKIAGVMIDPQKPQSLRKQAAIALVTIGKLDLFREALTKMSRSDTNRLAIDLAPVLGLTSRGDGSAETKGPTKKQINAKDALYLLLDYTDGKSRAAVVKPLVNWLVEGDYNYRAMAGYNVVTIAKKIGKPAAIGLVKLLKTDQVAIEPIARLIKNIDDPEALKLASEAFAAELKANKSKIAEVHLVAAAIIGGDAIAVTLLEIANLPNINSSLRKLAVYAYSESITKGNIKSGPEQVRLLFALAENESLPKALREETYYTIAQVSKDGENDRIEKLLSKESFFWKMVGLRSLLRADGEARLEKVLQTEKFATDTVETGEIVDLIGKFPKLLPTVRKIAAKEHPFSVGVAVMVIGKFGDLKKDKTLLTQLEQKDITLPETFEYKTLKAAATAAKEMLLKQKG